MTKHMRVLPLLLSACLLLGACVTERSITTPPAADVTLERTAQLDAQIGSWAQSYVDEGKLAGLITLVHEKGDLVHLGVYGDQDMENATPMARDTLIRIFSMTKPVTSVAAMILVEEGKIALDAPIEKWLPQFKNARVFSAETENGLETVPAARPITLHDLLTHNAGLTYGIFSDTPVDRLYRETGLFSLEMTAADFAQRLGAIPLLKQPGSGWYYSVATDLLGHLVEQVSGQSLDDFFQTRIFEPLGMEDTFFYTPEDKLDRLAQIYVPNEDGTIRREADILTEVGLKKEGYRFLSGGGGLISTMDDYLAFSRMLLNGGSFNGARIPKPETVSEMTRNQLPEDQLPLPGAPGFGFGLGFSVLMDPEAAGVGAKGEYAWSGAASTTFWIDPLNERIVILMTQMSPSTTYPLRRELKGLIYGSPNQ